MEADPFLFSWHGRLFLFYESKRLFSPGVIMMRYTDDLLHWSDETLVLQESFHLSFPNVLNIKGKYICCRKRMKLILFDYTGLIMMD